MQLGNQDVSKLLGPKIGCHLTPMMQTMRCLKMALLSKVKTSLKTLPRLPCVVLQNDPKGIVKV